MRGFGRVYRRGSIYWIAYYHRGREYRESTHSTSENAAERRLKERWKAIGAGKRAGGSEERVTVEEILRDLEADYRIKKRASLSKVKGHIAALLDASAFGGARAIDVDATWYRRVVETWQQGGVAEGTINRRRSSLMRAYRLAQEAGKLTTIPKLPRLDETNVRQGFFEKGTFFSLLGHLPDDGLRDFVEWAFWTGMRKGEIASLRWDTLDRETWTLRLRGRDTKSRRPRRLILVCELRAIIERRLAARRLDCPFIFHRHGKPIRHFRRSWERACKAVGAKGRVFHDLRRTGIRNLVRAGVERSVAMKISGHRTESVFERYNITADDDLRQAVELLSAYVERLPQERTVISLAEASGTVRVLSESPAPSSPTVPEPPTDNC